MVTYKSLKIFESEGITYLGIPEDMIIDFLTNVVNSTRITSEKVRSALIDRLGIVAAVKEELDSQMADLIDATIMEQIIQSDKPVSERAVWVKNQIAYVARSEYYRYTTDNIEDLNAKLKIQYRLAWVYKIMSQRHQGIETKFDHLAGKNGGGKTVIMIPKAMVEAAKETIADSMQALTSGIKPEDYIMPSQPAPEQQVEKKASLKGQYTMSDEQKEITELVLALLQREKSISMASLKRKTEQNMDRVTITFDAFSKILRNLEVSGFIVIDGTMISTK